MQDTPPDNFVLYTEGARFTWPGGAGVNVGQVTGILSDLALHFNAPMILDGDRVALVLYAPGVGPMSVVAESIAERELSDREVEHFCFSRLPLNLFVGRSAVLEAAKDFVSRSFPEWADVRFFDEC